MLFVKSLILWLSEGCAVVLLLVWEILQMIGCVALKLLSGGSLLKRGVLLTELWLTIQSVTPLSQTLIRTCVRWYRYLKTKMESVVSSIGKRQ